MKNAFSIFLMLSLASSCLFAQEKLTQEKLAYFETRIRPALVKYCYECHSEETGKTKGGLLLDTKEGMLQGGDNGNVLAGDPYTKSLFWEAINWDDLEMPPKKQMPAQVIQSFQAWLQMGAPDPRQRQKAVVESKVDLEAGRKHWAFQRPVATPGATIDSLVSAKLTSARLAPVGPADAPTLLRRLSFDLIGLPPTPEESIAFVKAVSGNRKAAIQQAVDRLIASPHFGERWARHWMDWVRYAESLGSEGDPRIPHAVQYRNYLIRALNADVPYDQLLREHIAGDLLPKPRVNEKLGLNESAIGPAHYRFFLQGFAPTDALDELVRTTEDQIDVVSKAFLGLTVSCARCHNHKFDAISQKDYHAFYSIMTSTRPATINVDSPARQAMHKKEMAKCQRTIQDSSVIVLVKRGEVLVVLVCNLLAEE